MSRRPQLVAVLYGGLRLMRVSISVGIGASLGRVAPKEHGCGVNGHSELYVPCLLCGVSV